MIKKWQIAEVIKDDEKNLFPEINPAVLQLLSNRGIKTQEDIDNFLNPDYENLYDPFLFRDMEKAVKRIFEALKKNEKITIFGDYDADGVTSAVLLKKVLEEIGGLNKSKIKNQELKINVYIPHRGREGYGLNKDALTYIKEQGTGLIITVDCGVGNFEEVEFANSLGIDIIITDHHYPSKKLPCAFAIINPKVENDTYPFSMLAGVGVAFKLAQGIIQESKKARKQESKNLEGFEKWILDLVALGTVADCCPLTDENRILTKYGLIVLNKTKNLGIKTLIETAGIAKNRNSSVICPIRAAANSAHQNFNNKEAGAPNVPLFAKSANSWNGEKKKLTKKLDTWAISFQIAPRINSAGRIDHANTSYELLVTEDEEEAQNIAEKLNETNLKRQDLTNKAVNEAIEIIEKEQKGNTVLFVKKDWEPGIIGLISGKITEHYNRPSFVFTKIGKELAASGRSIPEFNIIKQLAFVDNYLRRYGGHSQACGLSLKDEKEYGDFTKEFLKIAEAELQGQDLTPSLKIDGEITLDEITWELWDQLQDLEPFGEGNPQPLFLINNLRILEIKLMGDDGKHLKLKLQDKSGKIINGIGFSLNNKDRGNSWGDELHIGEKIDLAGYIDVNEWNGNRELQVRIVDIRKV
ncbi:MAG: DHH family phosphoesterase [bacterium]